MKGIDELVEFVKERTGTDVSKAKIKEIIKGSFDGIAEFAKQDGIKINSFGSFSLHERSARQGRDPRTGEPIQVQASKTVKFKASSVLKEKG